MAGSVPDEDTRSYDPLPDLERSGAASEISMLGATRMEEEKEAALLALDDQSCKDIIEKKNNRFLSNAS